MKWEFIPKLLREQAPAAPSQPFRAGSGPFAFTLDRSA